jgi:YHS domain-containing protein
MKRNLLTALAVPLTLVALFSLGCGKADEKRPAAGTAQGEEDAEIEKALASLPAEDQAAARAQRVCPVSGEALGSMGPPVKVEVEGREVFICCENCKAELEADPDKYLAKLEG